MASRVLPRSFYNRPTEVVARELLGQWLELDGRTGRIDEVEAYLPFIDPAAHSYKGNTRRTRVIFGPPGHAYVYRIYGMHLCLNVVAEAEGTPGCVLIRGAAGLGEGPGRLTRALGVGMEHYGCDLVKGPLKILEGPGPASIEVTPRIGIRHAAEWPLRFVARF